MDINALLSINHYLDLRLEDFRLLFQLQQGTPDTSAYMIAGYTVIFGVMLLYLFSLIVRRRNLQQDLEMLRELERQQSPLSSASPAEKRPAGPV